ncbi:MAG TPA: D-glycero-beta-D-manno-heptose 1,7-bisphosphate 7-phosphatase [Coriobacteriia bacterium]
MLTEAVILAGGEASRLGPLAAETPKTLMPVGGRPFLDHLVWNVRRHGIRRVVFATGRLGEQVEAHVGDGSALGVEAVYVREDEPLGTGGAARLAAAEVSSERFLLLNGDTVFDVNYLDLALLASRPGTDVAVALRAVDDVSRFGRVALDGERVAAFGEKDGAGPGLVNGGVYVVAREALAPLPKGRSSLETGLLAPLAAAGRLAGRPYGGFFLDIGLPASLEEAQRTMPAWRRKPAVFLDRDGVLNEDVGYAHTPEEFRFIPGAPEAVKLLNDAGRLVFVVTNQAGIGRGYYTEEEFAAFTAWIGERLAERGAHVDATYYCPHHPTHARDAYLRACGCRKPAPGMLLQAMAEWDVDADASVVVGDKPSDAAAAAAAGLRSVTYAGGDLRALVRELLGATAPDDTPEA